MERIDVEPREDWRETAEAHGFNFHSPEDDTYWDESACYCFSLDRIEKDIEDKFKNAPKIGKKKKKKKKKLKAELEKAGEKLGE